MISDKVRRGWRRGSGTRKGLGRWGVRVKGVWEVLVGWSGGYTGCGGCPAIPPKEPGGTSSGQCYLPESTVCGGSR